MDYHNGCSGSLSASQWVDTVAHCVSDDNKLLSNRIITVILGEHDNKTITKSTIPTKQVKVAKMLPHNDGFIKESDIVP